MTKKVLDWNKIAGLGFDDKRRLAHNQPTFKEVVAKSLEKHEKLKEEANFRKSVEPLLKAQLLDYMVSRKPIKVMRDIQNPTETLNGITNNEDDDGFYNGAGGSQDASLRTANATFQEVMEIIPQNTELVFKSLDKQLGQWIFKSSNGKEYAVYDKPTIIFQGQVIENPGFFGLLYNTNLITEIGV